MSDDRDSLCEEFWDHHATGLIPGRCFLEHDRLLDALIDARAKIGGLKPLVELVARQAEDDGLWFEARRAPEAYLQQELRRLHAMVEALWRAVNSTGNR